jgi:extracellular elastinolytic metalloproteinase
MRWRMSLIGALALVALLSVSTDVFGKTAKTSAQPVQFLTGPNAGNPIDIALGYIRSHASQLGLTAADISGAAVTDQYTDKSNGTTHIYLRQRQAGIEVYNGNININVARDGAIINLGNQFVSNLAAAVRTSAPQLDAKQGVQAAAKALGLDLKQDLQVAKSAAGPSRATVFNGSGISLRPIPAKLVFVAGDGGVRLAWNVAIDQTDSLHDMSVNVDAATGEALTKVNHVSDAGSYNVFAPPKESPNDGPRTLETNPDDALASPFGWHDTNGAAGAESTKTIGNNVHAATDLDANNSPDAGSEPDGGPSLLFDFPLDLSTQDPSLYRPAAVTNLFFWNNYIHDVTYHYGFDEASGNFQENDYGRGGLGNDSVNADAQDGSGINNANFDTPVDGLRPRMQMYVWRSPSVVHVNSPAAIAGDYQAAVGGFGLVTTTGFTGDLQQPADALHQGCNAPDFAGFVAGHVALIDRGTCTFSTKVRNAQNAGATGVVVINNVPGPPAGMAQDGTPNQPTIPAVMVSQADGGKFKANLPANVTVHKVGIDRDSDLDNGVIAHEYTHGISNRLTGGPSNVDCLDNAEEEGEGWSDFVALVLTAKTGQTGTTSRPIGEYVNFLGGIRPTPYTTDMSVNPSTYDSIKTNGEVHFTGYVWASMLWEVYWNLVNAHGFNPNIYGAASSGGNNLALQEVIDGMKLQPCSPGFVDSRNAILLADQNDTGGQNQCLIWKAFAKRGLGYSANQGSSNSTSDGTQAFDVPSLCGLSPVHAWLGVKRPEDQGTQFDLRAELLKNGSPVASGVTRCISGLVRAPGQAKEAVVNWDPFSSVPAGTGDVLSLRLSARIGTNPDGTQCAGHASAGGLRVYYDATKQASRFDVTLDPNPSTDEYLHSDGGPCNSGESAGVTTRYLNSTAPSPNVAAKCKDSSGVSFSGGNAWQEVGTWTMTLP